MLPRRVAGKMKVQASVATGIGNVIFDLVADDRLIAQITLNSLPVPP